MTDMYRINVSIPADLEKRIIDMRKTDEYCRSSISDIIRKMLEKGLDEVEQARRRDEE